MQPIDTGDAPPVFIPKYSYLAELQRVAAIIDPVPTLYFVTASNWGRLCRELCSLPKEVFLDPSRAPKLDWKGPLQIMSTTVVNSGTDDRGAVNYANWEAERRSQFREKHDKLAIRAGDKKPVVVDNVDPV